MAPARQFRQRLEVAAFKAGGRLAPRLPESVANAAAAGIRVDLQQALVGRRLMIERHMRRALGPEASRREVRRAVEGAFDSYARYWVETLRLGGFSAERVERVFSIEGRDVFFDALALGKGVVLALPHLGNWEVAGAWVALQGIRLTAVAEKLEPEELYEWFVDLREKQFGMHVIGSDDPDVARKLTAELRGGHAIALLSDRDLSRHGPTVEFFGEETTLPVGPALFAIRTGAPLLPVGVFDSRDWTYRAVVRPPLAVPTEGTLKERTAALTQELAYELEGLIRRAPQQWHLAQPNWPSDREALARWRDLGLVR